LYKESFDGFLFWKRIKSLVKWYRENAEELIGEDPNYFYWLGSGILDYLEDYKNWLLKFTNNNIFLKNIGINNPTWDYFISEKMKKHEIEVF
jgi:hypothetical protein